MSWIDNSINEYYTWLRDKTVISEDRITGWHTISTPFIGMFNDNIEVYIKMENEKIILSDDGITLSNLELSGTSVKHSFKRKEWLEMVLVNYGITLKDNELQTIGRIEDFNQKKHNLICAISEVSDMAMMAKHTVASLFKEDVREYLDEQEITYTPEFIAKGTTGIEFTFDFQIAGKQNELVLKSFSSLTKTNVSSFLFGWNDIKSGRENISKKEVRSMAIVNDIYKIKPEYLNALKTKNADCILWSERNQPKSLEKLKVA